MKLRFVVFGVLLYLSILGYTTAQEVQVFKQFESAQIIQSCFFNNSWCSTQANCNVTVFSPNFVVLLNDSVMDNHETYHNRTISSNQTKEVGNYEYRIVCSDQGSTNFGVFNFKVTASGDEISTSEAIIYIIIVGIAMFLFGLCIFGFIRIPISNTIRQDGILDVNYYKYVKLILIYMAYLILIFISFSSWQISENLVYFDFASGFMQFIFFALMAIALPLLVGLGFFSIILLITDRKTIRAIQRGIPLR